MRKRAVQRERTVVHTAAPRVTLNPARVRGSYGWQGLRYELACCNNPSAAELLAREGGLERVSVGRFLAAGLTLQRALEEGSPENWMARAVIRALRDVGPSARRVHSNVRRHTKTRPDMGNPYTRWELEWLLNRILARKEGDRQRRRRQLAFDFRPPPTPRETLYAIMRELGSQALVYFARGREVPGTIPVGAAFFDDVIRGAMREEFVSAVRKYPPPSTWPALRALVEEALEDAREALVVWVTKHNARRSCDRNWLRDPAFGASDLLVLRETIRRMVDVAAP